jgi:hypothetical protein
MWSPGATSWCNGLWAAIKKMEKIEATKIRVTTGRVAVVRGGVPVTAISAAEERVTFRDRPIPDVLAKQSAAAQLLDYPRFSDEIRCRLLRREPSVSPGGQRQLT